MSKIRINDLARELEVKSKAILDLLPEVGVTEKKTHSSSLEDHEAEKVRAHFRASAESQTATARSARSARGEADEIRTKIDLSHISKPGDVLKAISQKAAAAAPPPRPGAAPPPVPEVKPAAAAAKAPIAVPPKPAVAPPPAPRVIMPPVRPPVTSSPVAPPPPEPVTPPATASAPQVT